VSAGSDGTVRVWNLEDGHAVILRGHDGAVQSAAFNDRGDRVVSAGIDGSVRVWDPRGGPPLLTMQRYGRGGASSATFSPDGSRVLSAGDGSLILLEECDACGSLEELQHLARARA